MRNLFDLIHTRYLAHLVVMKRYPAEIRWISRAPSFIFVVSWGVLFALVSDALVWAWVGISAGFWFVICLYNEDNITRLELPEEEPADAN
jgi:hypothetical protein